MSYLHVFTYKLLTSELKVALYDMLSFPNLVLSLPSSIDQA